MSAPTVAQRLARLEDLAGIERVTARYAEAINHGYHGKTLDTEAIAVGFTPNARWHSDGIGTTVGAGAIAAALPAATARVQFAMHAFLNPVITLHGDTATGSWLFWIASVIDDDPRAVYMAADLTYQRADTEDGWQIHTIDIHPGIRIPTPAPIA